MELSILGNRDNTIFEYWYFDIIVFWNHLIWGFGDYLGILVDNKIDGCTYKHTYLLIWGDICTEAKLFTCSDFRLENFAFTFQ